MWEHDADLLPGLAARLDGEPGRVVAAVRAELLAGASALSGDREEGRQRFVAAVRRWRDLGADFERALCQVSMVASLGAGPETAAAATEARETFQRLHAIRFRRAAGRRPVQCGGRGPHRLTPSNHGCVSEP